MKRSRPDADTVAVEETGVPARPRVSEAYSDSTCDSGVMEVQRIHSAIPFLPEARKTDGVCEPPVAEYFGHRAVQQSLLLENCASRKDDTFPTDDQAQALLCLREFDGRGIRSVQKAAPQPATIVPIHLINRQTQPMFFGRTASRPVQLAAETSPAPRIVQQPNTLARLPEQALLQQLALLEADEKGLLAQLRSLRREYDARVSAMQPGASNGPRSGQPSAASHPRLPPRHCPPSTAAPAVNKPAAPAPPPPPPLHNHKGAFLPRRANHPDGHPPPAPMAPVQIVRKPQGMPPHCLRRPFVTPAPPSPPPPPPPPSCLQANHRATYRATHGSHVDYSVARAAFRVDSSSVHHSDHPNDLPVLAMAGRMAPQTGGGESPYGVEPTPCVDGDGAADDLEEVPERAVAAAAAAAAALRVLPNDMVNAVVRRAGTGFGAGAPLLQQVLLLQSSR